jgi:hypothetical protein
MPPSRRRDCMARHSRCLAYRRRRRPASGAESDPGIEWNAQFGNVDAVGILRMWTLSKDLNARVGRKWHVLTRRSHSCQIFYCCH